MVHLNGIRVHYDLSTLIDKRRTFMEWWSKTLIEQGLWIEYLNLISIKKDPYY